MSDLTGALELETKSFGALEIKDAEQGEVTAIVATLSVVDKDGDVLLPGSFPPTAPVKISFYGHDVVMDGAAPVGKGTITVQGDKAIFQGRFFMSTDRGREAFHTVKELGPDSEWSFGYPRQVQTQELSKEWRAKGARRVIAGIQPIEASPVFRGAGIGTGTVMAKARSNRDLPPALPLDQCPPLEVDKHVMEVLYFGWKHGGPDDPGTEPGMIRWFEPDGVRWASYDPAGDVIYLSTDLAKPENAAELIKSLYHERFHAKQYRAGHPCTEGAAEGAGDRGLKRWTAHVEELEAKSAANAARAFQRHFPGSSFDAAFDPHADLTWESRRPHAARAEYSYEVGAKYNLVNEATTSTVGEAAFRRLEIFARDLYSLVVRLNQGFTDAWHESGWYDRLAAVYSGNIGRSTTLAPTMGVQASVNVGLSDIFSRLDQVSALERQLGDQLEIFRTARGTTAAPSAAAIAALLPPRPIRSPFVGSTS